MLFGPFFRSFSKSFWVALAVLLLLVSLGGAWDAAHAAWRAQARVVRSGLYEFNATKARGPVSDAQGCPMVAVRHVKTTDLVPDRIFSRFGFEYAVSLHYVPDPLPEPATPLIARLYDEVVAPFETRARQDGLLRAPEAEPTPGWVLLTVRILHPPLPDPIRGGLSAAQSWDVRACTNATAYVGWEFTFDWERVQGEWAVELLQDGRVLASRRFQVVPAGFKGTMNLSYGVGAACGRAAEGTADRAAGGAAHGATGNGTAGIPVAPAAQDVAGARNATRAAGSAAAAAKSTDAAAPGVAADPRAGDSAAGGAASGAEAARPGNAAQAAESGTANATGAPWAERGGAAPDSKEAPQGGVSQEDGMPGRGAQEIAAPVGRAEDGEVSLRVALARRGGRSAGAAVGRPVERTAGRAAEGAGDAPQCLFVQSAQGREAEADMLDAARVLARKGYAARVVRLGPQTASETASTSVSGGEADGFAVILGPYTGRAAASRAAGNFLALEGVAVRILPACPPDALQAIGR
ncbi:MAG: DUF3859 domain-containing protein [Desulfovibrionaceae bacterium]|nr:DUF3859 domain-containing protein [Desulfovibrionaceae bacterium]